MKENAMFTNAAITAAASIASGCAGYAVETDTGLAVMLLAVAFGFLAALANARF